MKTTKIFMMAALAMMFAACSNEDNELFAPEQGELIPFKATIRIDNGKASNRALAEEESGLTATWAEGDLVALAANGNIYEMEVKSVEGGVATIKGSISYVGANGATAHIVYPYEACKNVAGDIKDDYLYNQTGGTLAAIASKYDVRTGTGKLKVESTVASLDGVVSVTNQNAIFKFTTKNADGTATIDMTSLTAYIGTKTYTITPTTASSEIYAALPAVTGEKVSFSATGSDGKKYILSRSGVTFAASKYYKSTLKMTQGVDLSKITEDYTAKDGDVLIGKLNYAVYGENNSVNVSIAIGATVTLMDVDINGDGGFTVPDETYDAPGLTLLGDATIVIEGTNKVQSYYNKKPGIYIPKDKSLTIQGTGSLEAKSKAVGDPLMTNAAGIGAAWGEDCGNIVIESGTVTAQGCTGIGGAMNANCGDITINGGNVTAIGEASVSVGIGSGSGIPSKKSECGDIVIEGGTIVATGKTGIGAGINGKCGNITINNGNVTATAKESEDSNEGAGIGSSQQGQSGNISIHGGTVIATGYLDGAGIGTSFGDYTYSVMSICGDITIDGGKVTATGGSNGGAGIGTGVGKDRDSLCGQITITNGVTSVTATKGNNEAKSIGAGKNGLVDKVTIGGTVYWDGAYHQNNGASYLSTSPLEYPTAP